MNICLLSGNLGKDPELRYTAGGTAVAGCSLATSESYKDKQGEWQEKTEWHNLVIWGKRGEGFAERCQKGDHVDVVGKIQQRTYDDRDGNKRYVTEIVVDKYEVMLRGRDSGGQGGRNEEPPYSPDDDIPF